MENIGRSVVESPVQQKSCIMGINLGERARGHWDLRGI